jgi:two-component system phosphate regulon sensor histidine kinase PhoR
MKASKDILLMFDMRYNKPVMVVGDQEKNSTSSHESLLTLKYGKKGSTEVSIEDLTNEKVIVRITDNGEGIEKKNIPRLLSDFIEWIRVEQNRRRFRFRIVYRETYY